VRKTVEEAFIVDGPREEWIDRCVAALTAAGFTGVAPNATLGQVSGNYKKLTVWGELALTLKPEGSNQTEIAASATANVDNIFALFGSPGRKIIQQFKSGLSAAA
jgi:hypothetical protein